MFQGASKSQMKQALRMVRNLCQPKTGASTGNGFAAIFCISEASSAKHNNMADIQCYVRISN